MSAAPSPQTLERLLALCRRGRFAEAAREAEALVAEFPGSLALWNLLGGACTESGDLDRAEAAFRQAASVDPAHAGAQYNLGLVLQRAGRLGEARTAYARALRRDPAHVKAQNNIGNVLAGLGRFDQAEAAHRKTLALRPGDADSWSNLGHALREQGRHDEALAAWRHALGHAPGHAAAASQMLRLQWDHCDFNAFATFAPRAAQLGTEGQPVPPLPFLSAEDHPARQRQRSEGWARGIVTRPPPVWQPAAVRPARLRIGYFSGSMHDHPTLRLLSGLLRAHDRSRFEVFVYSHGRHRTGDLRAGASRTVDGFHDVEQLSPGGIAHLARHHGLDIAIDLDGHTRDARPAIFACRPAPVTAAFLGYPGTTGAEFIDYLVADPVVVPDAERAHYSESVIFLPDTYQPNDSARPEPRITGTRADHGLPEEGPVLCCFNAGRKIGPQEFDLWMRLLRAVPASVLWLLRSNPRMVGNLRGEAARRGVDPDRLVFADPCPHESHIARYVHADIVLDTFRYNGHTTTSDALWAGVPVVTMAGRQFAARVAASLLSASGLPDLVTETVQEYEALSLALATDRARLAELGERVRTARRTGALFDAPRFARAFEAGLDAAHALYRKGQPPEDIRLPQCSPR
ncbi:TPR repeat protein [Pseudooceanicola batsensis HTCC2597]|uniref:protein O-GlcNAc transferase n=1 Tax=Pseudooceanicola batsensis (strain ATCC BAA-863 / DSM 15984 / KCTC 12145 / HTCC2597) TaxID=252305 RepID=A3U3W8_PSEBH|nr:tetratricopeptide repeat protein [Pseudooceanicola batsensis]EAQ01104.1 TPR repeat protein [Pseudooceanicola batsensis HTCC2597]